MHQNRRTYRKRFLSAFLAFVLLIGSFALPQLPVSAFNTKTSNPSYSGDYTSYSSATSLRNLISGNSLSENSISDNSLSGNSLSENSISENMILDSQIFSWNDIFQSDFENLDNVCEGLSANELENALSSVSDNNSGEIMNEIEESEAEDESVSSNTIAEILDPATATGTYTLTIDYNGGVDADGQTSYQIQANSGEQLSAYLPDAEEKIANENFLYPYTFSNKWILTYTDTGAADNKSYRKANSTKKINANMTLTAQWNSTYRSYNISYDLCGGSWSENVDVPSSYTYATETITLPSPVRKGYHFKGFYKDAAFTLGPVTEIPTSSLGSITLYARWESAIPAETPVLTKVTNPSKGNVTVSFKKLQNISGYELLMSTSKNFKKNTNTIDLKASATSTKLTNMPKGKTYYFKLRAFSYDSTGNKAYTAYSNVLNVKVKKGVEESKATSTSAKLQSCKIKNGNNLVVKFKVSKRIKSSDDSYYLVRLDPNTNKYYKMVKASAKLKTLTFELPLRDADGNDLIQGKFALAVKSGSKYKIISKGAFISNPEAAASYTGAFPTARSKKGLQGSTDMSLGLSHTFFNIDLNKILNGSIPYVYNGKTYYFNDPWSHIISACNEAGLTVTGQIMLSYNESTKYMILKSGRTSGKAYYAINVQDKKARETFEAAMNFLAERYGKEDCHLDNWIIGNEVNIHQTWYYAGNISKSAFMKNYASTFRIMYYAVRSHSANSRVYICTDHTWSNRGNDWGAKPFMDAFNKEIKSQQKNIQWNLAYHAYPSVLTSAATWNDRYVTNKNDTEFVSPKNLDVLTKYVKKNFGSKTRIILSEQGFTSSSGKDVQAAAIAYTYYKAEFNSMIDAVIFRSDIDNEHEGAQGLYMGLKDLSGNKKPAYDVFKYMDTPQAETYTNPYLKTIGISKWKDIAPKYTLKRFK